MTATPQKELPTSKDAKRMAIAILDVMAGSRTPQQAADAGSDERRVRLRLTSVTPGVLCGELHDQFADVLSRARPARLSSGLLRGGFV